MKKEQTMPDYFYFIYKGDKKPVNKIVLNSLLQKYGDLYEKCFGGIGDKNPDNGIPILHYLLKHQGTDIEFDVVLNNYSKQENRFLRSLIFYEYQKLNKDPKISRFFKMLKMELLYLGLSPSREPTPQDVYGKAIDWTKASDLESLTV